MIAGLLAVAVLVARLCLVGVFAVAGVAKLRDRHGTWAMMRAFGAGVRTSDVAAPILPFVELATALALIPTATAAAGAIAALVLLAAFCGAIAFNLASGRKPECRCFGSIGSSPIGTSTLVRNGAFAALAVAVLLRVPAISDPLALGFLAANLTVAIAIVLAIVVVGQSAVLWQVLLQQARMLVRLDMLEEWIPRDAADIGHAHAHAPSQAAAQGLPVGESAPGFSLLNLNGALTSLDALRALGKPVGLFFVHPTCGPCRALVPHLVRWSAELDAELTTVIVTAGTAKENAAFLPEFAPERVLLQHDHDVADAYAAYGTPAAVIVDVRGKIASDVAAGRDAIARLVGRADDTEWDDGTFVPSTPGAPAIGSPAPEFSVATTDGGTLASRDLHGSDAVLVFWSPTCGFCRQAAEDLVAWEARSDARLVVLSSAPDDDLVVRGLQHAIAIDEGMHVGHTFGAGGTPMAIRIAADGTIASKLAAGRDAIGQLVRPAPEAVI